VVADVPDADVPDADVPDVDALTDVEHSEGGNVNSVWSVLARVIALRVMRLDVNPEVFLLRIL
tara:strand:+ start:409 stop:597 length:189 start_codon:yes stop_codon:yes gene_type:complete